MIQSTARRLRVKGTCLEASKDHQSKWMLPNEYTSIGKNPETAEVFLKAQEKERDKEFGACLRTAENKSKYEQSHN